MVSFVGNVDFEKSKEILAVSVGHCNKGYLHNKLLYNFNNSVREIHLGWHHCFLHSEIKSSESYIWKVPNLPKSRLRSIVAKCILVSENQLQSDKKPLPYAIGYYSGREFNQEGVYTDDESGIEYGMTCATFILTLFKSVGVNLLDWQNWIVRKEDKAWFDYILYHLEEGYKNDKVSKKHLDNVKNEVNCSRFRPEEVFGSLFCSNTPSSFECSSSFGYEVKSFIISLPPEY
jgi:hypothetical protein